MVDASNADDYVSPITCSRSKAIDRLQPQSTKEGRKATANDSSISKYLQINNESSPTKTFFMNSSSVMRNLTNEVPLTHLVSSFSSSYLEVMLVMMTNTSTMEEKMIKMEQRVILLTNALEKKALLNMDIPPQWPRYLSNNCKT